MEAIIGKLKEVREELSAISANKNEEIHGLSHSRTQIDEIESQMMRKIHIDYATDLIDRAMELMKTL